MEASGEDKTFPDPYSSDNISRFSFKLVVRVRLLLLVVVVVVSSSGSGSIYGQLRCVGRWIGLPTDSRIGATNGSDSITVSVKEFAHYFGFEGPFSAPK